MNTHGDDAIVLKSSYALGTPLETVDGGLLEDVTISNITMRDVSNTPFFLRIDARMRGPAGREIGKLRRITISDVTVHNAPRYPSMIIGLPGHDVEDVRISNVRIHMRGGLSMREAADQPANLINTFFAEPGAREPYAVPDRPTAYPEPSMEDVDHEEL